MTYMAVILFLWTAPGYAIPILETRQHRYNLESCELRRIKEQMGRHLVLFTQCVPSRVRGRSEEPHY